MNVLTLFSIQVQPESEGGCASFLNAMLSIATA